MEKRVDSKDKKIWQQEQARKKKIKYEELSKSQPISWQARMPPYAGTGLCPDPRYRGGEER